MRILLALIMFSLVNSALACNNALLDQNFRKLAASEMVNLCETYVGKVLLVVNTASKCGYTPQYEELEQLYDKYQSKGLVVLGFPSNDFMGQEPGTEAEIQDFCRLTYDVKFPMFEKTTVKKGHAHPFYVQLAELSGTYPTWNFQKYLIGRDGQFIVQFSPHTKPSDQAVVTAIEQALRQ
ncbi:glutathione peroxidase [Nitrosomonas ureae]|uniref:Glutathione peroxidase n=1 Tax=Nitrosomonas ureae TaxID=44577 RepID=A0A285BWE0_9PROT|nr:glutathione peroxidase [Nitrosomonas ureae]SNX59218.1 glutathione peroxidase [Nitrosomonas ureae]